MSAFQSQMDQIKNQEDQIFMKHDLQIQKLKDEFFFGLRFNNQQEVKRATNIFTGSLIFLQASTGVGCIYSILKKKYVPSFVLFGLSWAFGLPITYRVKKNEEITAKLDVIENDTRQKLAAFAKKKQQLQAQQQNNKNRGFIGSFKTMFS